MIKLLRISNIAIMPDLELELGPGFTVFTGETGAGKSILIDALGLVLGERASADVIRRGADRATVEAVVEDARAAAFLAERGLPVEDDDVIVRREVHAAGKGRASLNGALVPVSALRELAGHVAAIHGQHEPQGLLDAQTHLPLLDAHAGLSTAVAAAREAFRRHREAEGALRQFRADLRESARRREMLEYQAREIEEAALAPGEEESLRREKVVQANAGRLATLSSEAYALLYDDERAVLSQLAQVYRRLEDLARIDPRFEPFLESRLSVRAQLEDLAFFLRDYGGALQVSPGRVDEIEARLVVLERLKKKYGATVEEVIAFGARCRDDLADLGAPEEREKALAASQEAAAADYLRVARDLARRRRAAAKVLAKAVEGELAQLAMEKTRFEVAFTPGAVPVDGGD
ncbi:MAG TPA: AAA family ATPase, partial [Vicinamibacteria bacterium]|nr:AAA family ATPase [Vicinamibacteria bacterium]